MGDGAAGAAALSRRAVTFRRGEPELDTPVYGREQLLGGASLEGPAIIEQADTTILVYPQQTAEVDRSNNLNIIGISKAYTQ